MKHATPRNFLDTSPGFSAYDKAKIVILPIPFDRTSIWLRGAARSPDAIIEASRYLEDYDTETKSEIYRKGIFTDKPILAETSEEMIKKVYAKIRHLLADGKFVVTLGGEHSVSIPSIRAHAEKFKSMSVLHLDAHSDRRDFYGDNTGGRENIYSHACIIARAKESVKNVVSVGVRSMDSSELESAKKDKIFYAHEIRGAKESQWINKVVNALSDNVYVTIDVDVFEIGLMPSTGMPEPGGLGWYEVTRLLRAVAKNRNIVGFDVVELCPNKCNKAPDALAAKLVQVLLSYKFFGKGAQKGV